MENSSVLHLIAILFAILTGVVTVGTMWQITSDIADRQAERQDAREERLARAWSHLMTRIGGQSGKGAALNIILRSGEKVDRIELSCKTVGDWDDKADKCINKPEFDGLSFGLASQGKNYRGRNIPRFADVLITNSDFSGMGLFAKDFENVRFEQSNLERTTIYSSSKIDLFLSSLKGAKIYYKVDVAFAGNISDVVFYFDDEHIKPKGSKPIPAPEFQPEFGSVWFWADEPPVLRRHKDKKGEAAEDTSFLSAAWIDGYTICDPKFRVRTKTTTSWFGSEAASNNETMNGEDNSGYLTDNWGCETLTLEEARKQFPAQYPVASAAEL